MARYTNEQLMSRMMQFSPYGALAQAFIMEAVTRYVIQCASAKPEDMDSALISGAAWHGVALDLKRQLVAQGYIKPDVIPEAEQLPPAFDPSLANPE